MSAPFDLRTWATPGRLIVIALTVAGAAGAYWAWTELGMLRRTWFFEYRFLTLLVATFVVFSALQWLAARIDKDKDP